MILTTLLVSLFLSILRSVVSSFSHQKCQSATTLNCIGQKVDIFAPIQSIDAALLEDFVPASTRPSYEAHFSVVSWSGAIPSPSDRMTAVTDWPVQSSNRAIDIFIFSVYVRMEGHTELTRHAVVGYWFFESQPAIEPSGLNVWASYIFSSIPFLILFTKLWDKNFLYFVYILLHNFLKAACPLGAIC